MVRGALFQGIRAIPIDIEVGLSPGGGFRMVGLARDAVKESEPRLRHAILAAGFQWPQQMITVNLAPASVTKREAGLDLPLALSILEATGQISNGLKGPVFAFGEIGLDGRVKTCHGTLSVVRMVPDGSVLIASDESRLELALPLMFTESKKSYVPWMAASLEEAARALACGRGRAPTAKREEFKSALKSGRDFREIKGQQRAKRALEVAAAGGHNVLLIGPPGEGKTSLAQAFATVLPKLSPAEMLELTEIYSVKGELSVEHGEVVVSRPYRSVHHQSPAAAIIGGGEGIPAPGEVTLAHRGVLFMDELPLFGPKLLDILRQPLEDGRISLARVGGAATFPCEFILVAAMNPCRCGFDGEFLCGKCDAQIGYGERTCASCGSTDRRPRCRCSPQELQSYRSRISGPLLDRIDLKVRVSPLASEARLKPSSAESSLEIKRRVEAARQMQRERFKDTGTLLNARMPGGSVEEYCELHTSARRAMEDVNKRVPQLNMRGYYQLLKVSRTVADLNNSSLIYKKHVVEAADLCGHDEVRDFLLAQADLESCPGCGANVEAGDQFCRRCGAQLVTPKS